MGETHNKLKRNISKPFRLAFLYAAKFITNYSHAAFISVLVVLGLCSIGWAKFEVHNDVFYWNSPANSDAYTFADAYTEAWGKDPRVMNVVIDTNPPTNIINSTTLLLAAMAKVLGPINTLTIQYGGETVSLSQICARTYPVGGIAICQVQSVFAAWNYNATALAMDPSPLTTINRSIFFVNTTMGNKRFDPNTGFLYYASSIRISVALNTSEATDPKSAAMENEFEHVLMPSVLPTLPTLFDPFWTTTQTPGESNVAAVGFSHWYYAISCILVTFITAVYFGKADPVHSHVMLAFLSTGLLYFAIFAGMGLGVGIQSRGAPELIFVIPFIGALTGMNNIYMLFSLYSFIKRRDGLDDPKGLVEKVFEKSHARLLISLVLGFLGTIIGCQTAVPLVRFMARTSMCTIWITWFATVIGTGVFLYWDGVREAAGRYDVCPLMKGEVKATPMLPRFDSNVKHLADHSLITEDSHQLEGFFEKFLRRVYIPNFIKAWPLHILVILGFLALWIAGAYLTKQVTNKLSYDQVFAPDSALIRGVNEFPSSYPEVGNGIPIRIPLPVGIDYSNPLVQQQMDYFHYHLQTSPYTTGLLQSWWVAFRAFLVRANQTMGTNPVMFYGQLNIFLGTSPAGNIFGLDLDIRNGTIYKSRIATFAPVYMDLVHDAELYDGLKHDLWNISANYPALNPVYPTSPPFTLYEALLDNNLVKQSQFISALIMVIIAFGLALLYKSWVAIFVGVNIVGAYVIVFGFLNITGYGIGFTRSMVLALATGSCGNSSSIFCFEYQRAPGENGLERCQFAFTIVASYIYHITLVGILVVVILFAESQHLFTEIAVTYYCCVITAAGESFIFLPSIVSFVERIRKMISG